MAIPMNIEELVNGSVVESTRIEFKASFNPEPIIHTICAFANDIDNIGGGYIIVGIEEHDSVPQLPPLGVERSQVDGILKKLQGFCHCIEPLYEPIVEPMLLQERYVIVIWCPGGYGRPYKAARNVYKNTADKRYYIRKMASTAVASAEEERELFYASSDIPFDDRPNLTARVDDLSLALMRDYLREVGSALYAQSDTSDVNDLATDLQLIAGPPEDLRPRNVGLLMFCDHVERFFRYARIEVVDLPDPTGEGMTEQVFTGPIQRQLRDALLYLKNYEIRSRTVKDPSVAEATTVFNYPYAAVEEVLSNAVYHRSYQIPEPIVVRVTPDAMEITSYPGFDRSVSDSDIAAHHIRARIYRNRRIGDFLKELHLTEGRNTGFPTAFAALKHNSSPTLRFDMDENRGYLSVTIPVHPDFLPGERLRDKTEQLARQILEVLPDKPVLLSELARLLGYKSVSRRLRVTVNAMADEGKLKRVQDGARVRFGRP
ncbi:RNA-binding domain-containing protein [uncultured Olsenella sp.]|uniref:RNA-binding domain-containing protein n=2 Tax=Olsenella TaxID=133925 RepID=UPI000231EDC1|nr:RNA-binding domain-containing protein [uncultured Olsenella sp.]EHF02116.1 hypothetical protein HMPREF1008_00935 [Olsenella sp. oral taxon 809 str. F0356]